MGKYTKQQIIISIEKIVDILEDRVKWIIGASGALFVHGLSILPNDIDVIVDIKDYHKAKELLSKYLKSELISTDSTSKISFEIKGVACELFAFDLHDSNVVYKKIKNLKIPVNVLKAELFYYKHRTDKKEATAKKIALIEEALVKS